MPQPPADPTSAPILTYAPPRPGGRLRRWLRPGSPGFFLLILLLAGAGTWEGWKWRLREDEKAFDRCAKINVAINAIYFTTMPSRAALRHMARLPGPFTVGLVWTGPLGPETFEVLRGVSMVNVQGLAVRDSITADLLLKEIARPDTGLKTLTRLIFDGSSVTDAGLQELSRSDNGLNSLRELYLDGTSVTDAGLKELCRPGSGLKALTRLSVRFTRVTDTGLKELTRPDTGLKSLTRLNISSTPATDAGIEAARKARPGLTINP